MPGPPPKPTALKKSQGNPGKRALNKNEPNFSGSPECPKWLCKEAKAEWKQVTSELEHLNMIRSVDKAALASYCQSYARWQQAEAIISKEGQTVQEPIINKSGELVGYKTRRHPATSISKDAQAMMHRAAALFGFDPSNRSRINLPDAPAIDPIEAFRQGAFLDPDYDEDESGNQVH
jgi:P27 family predicted phage terminase small subunit